MFVSAQPKWRNPITGIAGCCARAASGGVGFVNAGLALAAKLDGLQEIPMTVYVIADIKMTDDGWIPKCSALA
jgi:hypothetical protein